MPPIKFENALLLQVQFLLPDFKRLTDSLISASECAADSVTKFTSLVRVRD